MAVSAPPSWLPSTLLHQSFQPNSHHIRALAPALAPASASASLVDATTAAAGQMNAHKMAFYSQSQQIQKVNTKLKLPVAEDIAEENDEKVLKKANAALHQHRQRGKREEPAGYKKCTTIKGVVTTPFRSQHIYHLDNPAEQLEDEARFNQSSQFRGRSPKRRLSASALFQPDLQGLETTMTVWAYGDGVSNENFNGDADARIDLDRKYHHVGADPSADFHAIFGDANAQQSDTAKKNRPGRETKAVAPLGSSFHRARPGSARSSIAASVNHPKISTPRVRQQIQSAQGSIRSRHPSSTATTRPTTPASQRESHRSLLSQESNSELVTTYYRPDKADVTIIRSIDDKQHAEDFQSNDNVNFTDVNGENNVANAGLKPIFDVQHCDSVTAELGGIEHILASLRCVDTVTRDVHEHVKNTSMPSLAPPIEKLQKIDELRRNGSLIPAELLTRDVLLYLDRERQNDAVVHATNSTVLDELRKKEAILLTKMRLMQDAQQHVQTV